MTSRAHTMNARRTPFHPSRVIAVTAAAVAFFAAGTVGASAIPNVPDPAPAPACQGSATWDGEANLAARHAEMDVFWWSRIA